MINRQSKDLSFQKNARIRAWQRKVLIKKKSLLKKCGKKNPFQDSQDEWKAIRRSQEMRQVTLDNLTDKQLSENHLIIKVKCRRTTLRSQE